MTGCFIDSGLDHGISSNCPSYSPHYAHASSDISQGSVVTQLRCGEIISQGFVANFASESVNERSLKIGQHLAKLWTIL